MKVRRLAAGIAMAVLASGAAFGADADTVLAQLFEPGLMVDGLPGGDIWTPELAALWMGIPEDQRVDFVTPTDLAPPRIKIVKQSAEHMQVSATAVSPNGRESVAVVDLANHEGNWLVDEIEAEGQILSEMLRDLGEARQ